MSDAAAIRARAANENFPVAFRWLPRSHDLLALYDVARLIDHVGDEADGDRREQLETLETDLRAAFGGTARHPVMRALTPTLERHALPAEPFLRLIEANRRDQELRSVPSWEALRDYCALSAEPVGELVLRVFDQLDEISLHLSNDVCSALQVVEHCQDVAEDFAAGRIYLPAEDRARFGCSADELPQAPASDPLRRVVALQVSRARSLLASGNALVRRLRGGARFVVSAYVAGGVATCDALERADFDPNTVAVRPRRRDWSSSWLRLIAGSLWP